MSNVKNKSIDRRRNRRRRYIDAVEPFRVQFGCTAAQVHGHIQNVLRDNNRLRLEVDTLQQEVKSLTQEVEKLKAVINSNK